MQGKGAHRQELAVPSLNPSSESQAPALSRVAADSWCWASLMAQRVKNLPAMQKTQKGRVQFLGQEDPLEEEMAIHSSSLAWEVPWTEEPGGL